MEFKEVLQARRSVRAFQDQAPSPGQVEELIRAAQWAPSPLNLQPWRFLLIDRPELKAEVRRLGQDAARAVLEGGGPSWVKKYGFDFLEQAPLLILVLYDPRQGGLGDYFNQPGGARLAAAAAIQNLMLAAAEMGLGTVWFTFFDPGEMARALGVPEELEIAGILPVGVPAGETPVPPRKPARVYRNRFSD